MNTVTFDTYKVITRLEERGFSEAQAKGVVEVLIEEEFVTQSGLDGLETRLISEMNRQRVETIKWTMGILLAQAALIVALIEWI